MPAINYTNRDFDSILEELKIFCKQKFPDTYTNFYESGMGTVFMELIAFVFDNTAFNLDYRANEQYISTARDRSSLINLGKLAGYKLSPATGASVSVQGLIDPFQGENIIIDAGQKVLSEGGVTFRTLTDQFIPAGDTSADILFVEGVADSDTFVSDGTGRQSHKLSSAEVISGSIAVTVGGDTWTEVVSLVYSDFGSQNFAVEYDKDDYAYILFGDNESGKIPALNDDIVVTYRTGGGVQGNIAIGEINTSVQGYKEGISPISYVTVTFNNLERGSGGEERETNDHARYWIPNWVCANGRAVTEQDFDTLAVAFSDATYGKVAHAKARLKQSIPELNSVVISCWTRDDEGSITTPSSGLKDALEAYFNNNSTGAIRLICTDVEVEDGNIVYIDVASYVSLDSTYQSSSVLLNISSALDELFESTIILPGKPVRLSDVYKKISLVGGVEHCLIDYVTASEESIEFVASASGATATFSGTFSLEVGLPIVEGSVSFTAGLQSMTDDGDGTLSGDGTGTIDYDTGAYSITLNAVPVVLTIVTGTYRHILSYSRGELETTADGITAMFEGKIEFSPIVSYDDASGLNGIAFTDGEQVVSDSDSAGDGTLSGDGTGTIDYDTGVYAFTLDAIPVLGSKIYSTYTQMLKTSSEDIPIDKDAIAVKGDYSIRVS